MFMRVCHIIIIKHYVMLCYPVRLSDVVRIVDEFLVWRVCLKALSLRVEALV